MEKPKGKDARKEDHDKKDIPGNRAKKQIEEDHE